jgi:hypothetical protein
MLMMKRFAWLLILLPVILVAGCITEPIASDPLKAIERATAPVFKSLGTTFSPTVMRHGNPSLFSWEYDTRHTPVGTNGVIHIQPAPIGLWLTAELWVNDDTGPKAPRTVRTSYGFLYSYTVKVRGTDTLNIHLQFGPRADPKALKAITKILEKIGKQLERESAGR